MKYLKLFEDVNIKYKKGDIVFSNHPLDNFVNRTTDNIIYEIVDTKILKDKQFVIAKNIKTGLYKHNVLIMDTNKREWIYSDYFLTELEYNAKKYNL